jgi:hypothetical protein
VQQELAPAEVKLNALKVVETPISRPTDAPSTSAPAAASSGAPASPAAAVTASATPRPAGPSPTPVPLGPNQVRLSQLGEAQVFGATWVELSTRDFRVTFPSTWRMDGPSFGANGIGVFDSPRVILVTPEGLAVRLQIVNGEIGAAFNGLDVPLRSREGVRVDVSQLFALAGPDGGFLAAQLDRMLSSVVAPVPPTPTPTVSPTGTSSPSPSPQPASSSTPVTP